VVEAEASRTLPQARAMLRTLRSDDEPAALFRIDATVREFRLMVATGLNSRSSRMESFVRARMFADEIVVR